MNTKALRQKVLDLAIHGKLVPQNPNDESAEVLLKKIREEKAEKIKKGELKADKKDSFIFVGSDKRHYEQFADGTVKDIEDEIPFEVPEGWAWCRLTNVCSVLMGQSPEGSSVSNNPTGMEFHQGKIFFTERYLAKSESYTSEITRIAPEKSLLLCVRAPVGVVNITNREICIGRGLCAIKPNYTIDINFWFYWILCQKSDFEQKATGTTFKAISVDIIKQQLIPIPPLAEQQKIISFIEIVFSHIEHLEENKSDLQNVIKQTKSKILNLAIHGKLVPQNPTDEPAEELLKRIATSDNRPYKKLNENDTPYSIPFNWSWSKFGDYIDVRDGTHYSPKYVDNGYPFVTSKNLVNGKIDFSNVKYISEKDHKEFSQRSFVDNGDILFAMIGSIGNPVLVKKDREFSIKNVALFKPYLKNDTYMKYTLYFLMWIQEELKKQAKGGMQPFVPLNFFRQEICIPLPPLPEQYRIVSKIEELFSYLDTISFNLE